MQVYKSRTSTYLQIILLVQCLLAFSTTPTIFPVRNKIWTFLWALLTTISGALPSLCFCNRTVESFPQSDIAVASPVYDDVAHTDIILVIRGTYSHVSNTRGTHYVPNENTLEMLEATERPHGLAEVPMESR